MITGIMIRGIEMIELLACIVFMGVVILILAGLVVGTIEIWDRVNGFLAMVYVSVYSGVLLFIIYKISGVN